MNSHQLKTRIDRLRNYFDDVQASLEALQDELTFLESMVEDPDAIDADAL